MKAQGFDYVPVDPFAQQQALTGKARITDEEFTRQFGYGISTLFGKGNQQSDPNERIRATLSTADRAAYDRALGGDNPGITFAEAVDSGDFTELGGCTKDASEAAFGGAAVLTSLVEKLDELDERIIQDQRMVKATEKWAACLLEKGYRYEEPDEIDSDLEERFKAIVGTGVAPGTSTPPAGRELRPRRAHGAAARRGAGSRTPTSTARRRRSSRSSRRSARSTRSSSATRTSGCSRACSRRTATSESTGEASAGRDRRGADDDRAAGRAGRVRRRGGVEGRRRQGADGSPHGLRSRPTSPTRPRSTTSSRRSSRECSSRTRAARTAGGGRLPHRVVFTVTGLTKEIDGVRARHAVGPRHQRRQAARRRARLLGAGRLRERVAARGVPRGVRRRGQLRGRSRHVVLRHRPRPGRNHDARRPAAGHGHVPRRGRAHDRLRRRGLRRRRPGRRPACRRVATTTCWSPTRPIPRSHRTATS